MSHVHNLLEAYAEVGTDPPDWAYPSHASIPFIGKNYGRWNGVIVYASAENLAQYEREPETLPDYFNDDRILNRHRTAFECDSNRNFFRHVHMAPFDNGSLIVAASYFIWRQHGEMIDEPVDLLESIAVANFCKYSISGKVNKDYAGDTIKLTHSIPYVMADVGQLQPSVVLMPNSILKKKAVRDSVREAFPHTSFVGIPQFNSTVVNTHLKKHADRAAQLEVELEGTSLARWIDNLTGYASGYPYRYLVEIDEVLAGSN
ncbi:hypothetical protein Pla110_22280 [Polystyrenella longa]|uniref:Uncharacterized protein n=2 Tax=Polystyrenella longa TaxID=2528007 RepID=A0A518CMQ2_9PLAN|nr:hypothetical protein Pla110_22280 [Polystyrenella longa]